MTVDFLAEAYRVIDIEANAILALKPRLNGDFSKACELILACKGRTVVLGIGKSSYIGAKIAASFASTGTPAFFVHAAEASHGDLGMITPDDLVIAISNSGETPELMNILPLIKHLGVKLISICGRATSSLALASDVFLDAHVAEEACHLGLAPTASTTAALVLGDALAVTLLKARGFTPADFARTHPGGNLGKRLLLCVRDLMHVGGRLPIVTLQTNIVDALMEVTRKGFGVTIVVDESGRACGIFTDGDLRRAIDKRLDLHQVSMRDVMTRGGKTASADMLATEALMIMEKHKITTLVVLDKAQKPSGLIHMHDLLQAGVA
ncbi:MAG: D-arabinose 5-phosphate isomerase [Gammaproteobacteria bacterium]|jgi:arabinose-5-phosphate isomerase|nr:D-arabinose 5-phosphate isomerase [Gammaproteobacteria bacterium]